jgi:hypothetical protein
MARARAAARLVVGGDAACAARRSLSLDNRAGISGILAERVGDGARQVPLPEAVGPSIVNTGIAAGSAPATPNRDFEIIGPSLGDAAQVEDPNQLPGAGGSGTPLNAASDIAIAMR